MIFIIVIATTLWSISVYAEDTYPITIQEVEYSGNELLSVKTNSSKDDGFARAIAAIYNEDVLADVVLSNTVALKSGDNEFDFNSIANRTDNQTVKIFIWSSESNGTLTMSPLAQKYTIENNTPTPTENPFKDMRIKVSIGNSTGYISDLTNNSTTKAFLEMMPYSTTMQDLGGREYWFSHSLPYDEETVQHTYEIGEFTYWCGGWVTGYYDRNDDDTIEAGSVVIGTMDDTLINAFNSLNGSSVSVFDIETSPDKTYEVETKEIYTQNNGQNIYGIAYVPKNVENKVPTVIISHGYGGTSDTNAIYARSLASHGIAAYCFDFRGGSPSSRSDGKTTDMTVFTEVSDLNAVIDMVKGLDFTDTNNLFLLGTSQGGLVSALTAAKRADDIQGLMLFYPALCISDDAKSRYPSIDSIPETTYFMGMNVGREYYTSIYDYDIYENIAGYTDDVLIVHGDRDSVVPLSYSERAATVYNSADLKVLSGAGHGFYGQNAQSATDYILEYIKK